MKVRGFVVIIGFGPSSRKFALLATFAVSFISAIALSGVAQANSKYAGFVIDAKTGKTLYSDSADKLRYPASLTKMMTLYMMFDAINSGKLSKRTRIKMSRNAASRPPSKLGIKPGRTFSAEQAIYALTTKSANDVATAVAEHLGGTEPKFARMMTLKARALGMSRTTFKNANGLTAKGQLTTARDMARLGLALREHFPKSYRYFSTTSFKYGKKRYRNHNRLLGKVRGVDGIKTGYTRASGFNLVSSVRVGRRSIVAVVLGGKSGRSRNAHMKNLIGRYLKKASRRGKKQLVASRAKVNRRYAAYFTPKKSKTIDTKRVQAKVASVVTKPKSRPVAKTVEKIDPIKTSSIKSNWQIQIGASDSKTAANQLLDKAQSKANSALKSASKYIEPVKKNAVTLYRARFAGFSNKSNADKACRALKKKDFACLTINNG